MGPAASTNLYPRPVRSAANFSDMAPLGRDPLDRAALRYTARTQERLVPLGLTSFGLGSRCPLLGHFKSSSAAFEIEMGEHEAQKNVAQNRGT